MSIRESDLRAIADLSEAAGITPDELAAVWVCNELRKSAAWRTVGTMDINALRDAPRSSNGESGGPRTSRGRVRGGLHDEIVAVLKATNKPMTVSEIASQIRARGRYTSPRTGRPIGTESISTRVANPNYRNLFKRTGRLLTLAHSSDSDRDSSE